MNKRRGVFAVLLAAALTGAAVAETPSKDAFTIAMEAHLARQYGEARRLFEPLAAAGDARAQFMLGTIHEQGLGVPADLGEAAVWYRRAAEGGSASAQYNLGIFYQFGKGVPQDNEAAAHWLRKAAEQGHGRAQNNLSTFYYTGLGVSRDLAEAWKWLTLSAEDLKGEGREIALRNRSLIEKEMSPEQLADARRRAEAWHRAHQR